MNISLTRRSVFANKTIRIRGYQFRSEGPGEAKKNPSPFSVYDKSGVETPVAPEASDGAGELEGKGFAEKQA
jgi:queuine tRNA-ribosyltransferase subunit QTRTD1